MENDYIQFILIVIIILLLLIGVVCLAVFKDVLEEPSFEGRFTIHHVDDDKKVFVDNETGVCYLWIWSYNRAGLTVMLEPDGSPMIYKEE